MISHTETTSDGQTSLFVSDYEDNGVRYTEIDSALLSAQTRKRFYVTNFGDISEPIDCGTVVADILESGLVDMDKAYCLKHQAGNARDHFKKHHTNVAFEPVSFSETTTASGEPVRIGTIENDAKNQDFDSKQYRVYSPDGKATTLCGQGGGVGAKTGLYAVPINITDDGKSQTIKAQYYKNNATNFCCYSSTYGATGVAEPIIEDNRGWSMKRAYEVRNGMITVNGEKYKIKLADGFYYIRKLTVKECMRLQTVPEWYHFPVSETRSLQMLGNGWTVEVIKHLLSHIPNIQNEEIEVLSMYDGMSCGQIALKELGCNVVKYTAYEIDKYAIQTTQYNFPDTIQMGDAFQVREDNWSI